MKAEPRQRSMAECADIHDLYQRSVQDVESEIDFVTDTWRQLRQRPARLLREDFCGTANTACEWIKRSPDYRAIGVDLDSGVLAWGRAHNIAALSAAQQRRIDLLQGDVTRTASPGVDILLAMNFSYFLLMERTRLRDYFRFARAQLASDGVMFLDAYGGYEAPMVLEEERDCDGFTYIWEQAAFNPIDSRMDCRIHFSFPDGSRLQDAFSYRWRLWTLPEIRETLHEAGFSRTTVYWEGTDPESGEGDGVYTPSEQGDADAGWVCYLVAER